MGELLRQVGLAFGHDARELGPGDCCDVVGVLDDRLVFSPQVLPEQGNEPSLIESLR